MGKNARVLFGKIFLLLCFLITVFLISNVGSSNITNLGVALGEGSFIVNGDEITMFLYHNNNRYNLDAPNSSQGGLPSGLRNQINFDTNLIEEETGRFRYHHTFSTAVTNSITKVGYVFPDGCSFNSPVLSCSSYEFDFTEAITNQGLTINFLNNELTFEGEDLSYIDPIIDTAGSPDLSDSSGSDNMVTNSSGSIFVLYSSDPTTTVAVSDDEGSTWTLSDTGLDCDFDSDGQYGVLLINSSDDLHVICSQSSSLRTVFSTDSGTTWSTAVTISGNVPDRSLDAAIGPNDEIVVCTGRLTEQIHNSSDSGASWTTTSNPFSGTFRGCAIEYDSTGMIHIAMVDIGSDEVSYSNTTDPTNWGTVILVKDELTIPNHEVEIAIDPVDEEIFILTQRNVGGTFRTLDIHNSTNGVDWTTTEVSIGAASNLVFLDLAIEDDSTLHVIGTESVSANDAEVRYATSTDGGLTWTSQLLQGESGEDMRSADLRGSRFPSFNNISTEGVLHYVYENGSGLDLYFGNLSLNRAPTVSIVTPLNNSNHSTGSINVNFTATDPGGVDSCWYSNDTMTINITLDNCVNITTVTWSEGQHNVTVYANDTAGLEGSDAVTFTIDTTTPLIDFGVGTETDGSNISRTNIFVNVTVTEENEVNITFLLYNSTAQVNSTTFTDSTRTINFTGLPDETYTFNVTVTDAVNNQNTTSTRTVGIDSTFPLITYGTGTEGDGTNFTRTNIYINVSVTETNEDTITFLLHNSTAQVNSTTFTDATRTINFTGLADETYTFNVTVNDTVGNSNTTATRTVTIDTITPLISYGTGTENDGANFSRSNIFVNVTVTEENEVNITFLLYNSTAQVNSTTFTDSTRTINFTGLPDETYTFNVTVTDAVNNQNTTSTRTVTIDTTIPTINYVSPTETDGAFLSRNYIEINITASDTNLQTIEIRLYNSTQGRIELNTSSTSPFYINYSSLSDGLYFFNVTANDTVNNVNNLATRNVTLDTTNPLIDYVSTTPADGSNQSSDSIFINVSVTETNEDTITFLLHNSTAQVNSTSFTDSTRTINFTGLADETYTFNVTVNDTAGNSNTTSTRTVIIDTTIPTINYVSPTETSGTFLSRNYLEINVTATDSGVGIDTILIRLYNSTQDQINTSSTSTSPNYVNFSSLSDGLYFFNATANDTLNNLNNLATRNVNLDTITPTIDFASPTPADNSNQTSTSVTINVTGTEENRDTVFVEFDGTNYTMTCSGDPSYTCNYTNSTLIDGTYSFYSYINDSVSNTNTTATRTFRVDSTAPSLTLVIPGANEEFSFNTSISLNFTVSDAGVGLDTCYYNLDNGVNITLANCANITFDTSEATHTLNLFANDSVGNEASASNSFTISLDAPAITLNFPPNNTFFDSRLNIYLNYTVTDANGIGTVEIWHDINGSFSLNETNLGVTSGQQNFTVVNTSADGAFFWNIFANDTAGSGRFSANNFTFTVDTVNPSITIDDITTSTGSQTFTFDITATDTNLDSCWYSVFNSSGGIDSSTVENTSVTCVSTENSETPSDFGTYNLTVYVNDSANNGNSVTQSFTLTETAPSVGGGGGGTAPVAKKEIPVIGLLEILNGSREYSELDRMIIYATINNYCSEKLTEETLAVSDFSDDCALLQSDLNIIEDRLANFDVATNTDDLTKFFTKYKNSLLFQGFTTQDNINKFNLFPSVLGLTTFLQLNPPSIDKSALIKKNKGENETISFIVTSNKKLKLCEVISDTPDLSCTILPSNFSLRVDYFIADVDFLSRIFSGTLSITTDAEPDKIEQKRLSVGFRVYNRKFEVIDNVTIGMALVIMLLIPVGLFGLNKLGVFGKKRGKKVSKQVEDLFALSDT